MRNIVGVIIVSICGVLLYTRTYAQSSADITATAGVNICGNAVVETPAEECEGSDLNGATCSTQGYASGTLACDASCSFDTAGCVAASPSPSPSPSTSPSASSPAASPTATPSPSPSASSIASPAPPRPSPTPTPLPIIVENISTLPSALIALMRDAGYTDTQLLTTDVVRHLIDHWTQISRHPRSPVCDLNEDNHCDVIDFSIILFYTNRN